MEIQGSYKPVTIYALKHENVIKYVGQCTGSLKQRVYKHFTNAASQNARYRNLCPKLYDFIRENSDKEKYSVIVLEQTSREAASERERHWIGLFNTKDGGLNVTQGGRSVSGSDHYLYGKPVARHIVDASVAARRGKPLSAEHKAAIGRGDRLNSRTVIRDDGTKYPSVNAAARAIGVHQTAIRQSIKTKCRSGGFHWRYEDHPE